MKTLNDYHTPSVSMQAYYQANAFFKERTNREGVLIERAHYLADD